MALSKPPKTKAEKVAAAKLAASVNVPRRGHHEPEPRIKPNSIDWDLWRNMPVVKLWEAVALSLGQRPELVDELSVDSDIFVEPTLGKRLKIADSHVSAGNLKLLAYGANNVRNLVNLLHFCEWATTVVGWAIPQELTQLAAKPQAAGVPKQGSEPDKVHAAALPVVTTHKLKSRARELDAEIEKAKKKATNPSDYHTVWAALVVIAQEGKAPFTGTVDETSGIHYTGSNGNTKFLSKDALRKRMNPTAR